MKALLIIFGILFVAGLILMIVEKIKKTSYETIEAIIGAPLILVGGWLAYCILLP